MRSDPYKRESLHQGALHYLMGRGAAGVAGFLTVLLLVRYMDLGNYAAYTALSGLVAISGVVAGLGMERVVSRYVPEARLYRSVDELGRFIWLTCAVRLLAALLIVALLYIFWPAVDKFLVVTEFKIFHPGLACFIIAETMFQHFSSVLQALVMQKTLTRLLIIQWAGKLLLIGVAIIMKGEITWQDSLWISAIPELIGVFGFVLVTKLHLRGLHAEKPEPATGNWPEWKKVTETGMHNFGFILLAAPPQGYFMKVLTAAYLPVEVVAAYGFFLSIAERARQYIPLHFFYGLLEPMMIALYLKDRNFSALSYRCQLLYKSNLMLMIPAIAWVAAAGDPIVSLLTGGKFLGLSWILVLVMVQLTIGSHVVLLQLLVNSLEQSKTLIMASSAALPVMLLAMAISTVTNPIALLYTPLLFSLVMNSYIIWHLARHDYAYRPSGKMLASIVLSGFAAFVAATALNTVMPPSMPAIVLAIASLLAVTIAYPLVTWISKGIEKSEIDMIKDIVINIRRKKAA